MRLWTAISTGAGHESASLCEVMSAGFFSSLFSMSPYTGQCGQFLAAVHQRQCKGVCVERCVCVCVGGCGGVRGRRGSVALCS